MWQHLSGYLFGLLLGAPFAPSGPATLIREGSSPQLAIDARGTVRMVFGNADTIFAATSLDQGRTFGSAVVVGVVSEMHLGHTRGPVIASSRTRSMVASADKPGNIHLFELNHATGVWRKVSRALNDSPGSAPEGLITLAADDTDGFYAAWLDLRIDKRNQLFFARTATPSGSDSWTPNIRANTLSLGNACECCRPSIAVSHGMVAIMFRNAVSGSRDMYFTTSKDRGRTFAASQRLGNGTWKLDGCPMDGGALGIGAADEISTVWRREGTLYFARPGEAETVIGDGRAPMMSVGAISTFLIWQDGERIRMKTLTGREETVASDGRLPQVLALPDGRALTAWESKGRVYVRRMD